METGEANRAQAASHPTSGFISNLTTSSIYIEINNSALAANTVVGRLLEEAMVEHMVEHMVELMVERMVVAINECLRILFPFPTTKRRTSGVTVSR